MSFLKELQTLGPLEWIAGDYFTERCHQFQLFNPQCSIALWFNPICQRMGGGMLHPISLTRMLPEMKRRRDTARKIVERKNQRYRDK